MDRLGKKMIFILFAALICMVGGFFVGGYATGGNIIGALTGWAIGMFTFGYIMEVRMRREKKRRCEEEGWDC